VGDPAVGPEVIQQVVLGHLLSVADNLEDHDVAAVGKDERLFLTQ
jgi:hypothetical protein